MKEVMPDLSKLSHDEKDALILQLMRSLRESEERARAQSERLDQLTARVEQLEEMVEQRDKRIRELERENKTLVRRLYGPKSDRPGDEAQ